MAATHVAPAHKYSACAMVARLEGIVIESVSSRTGKRIRRFAGRRRYEVVSELSNELGLGIRLLRP